MQSTPKIEFRRVRDFGQLFNDVFRFHKYNLKTLFVCVLLIPGPLFLIAGGFYGFLQSMGSDPSRLVGMGMLRDPMSVVSMLLSYMLPYFILVLLGSLASAATINRYFILYQQSPENNTIKVGDILKHLPSDMWRIFYNGLLLFLIVLVFMIALFVVALIPILGALAIFVGLIILGPPLSYALMAGNYLVLRDQTSIIDGMKKAWGYMKGNFWWTWLIVVVAAIIVGIMGAIFGLPISALSLGKTLTRFGNETSSDSNSVLYIILGIIAILGPQLLVSITTLFSVMTYHSYEELHEGTAIKDKIDQVGKD